MVSSVRGVLVAMVVCLLLSGTVMAAEPMTAAEVDKLVVELSNWGRWGGDDQLGPLNLITPATPFSSTAAAGLAEPRWALGTPGRCQDCTRRRCRSEYEASSKCAVLGANSNGAVGSDSNHFLRLQIGDDQARSWIVAGRSGRGSMPARSASQVDQRQVGFSSTRT